MTATDLDAARHVRTYGGWRRTRGMGLFGLSSVGTVVVLACLVIPLVLGSDAHRPGDVGHGFDHAAGLARAAGYATLWSLASGEQEPLP